MHLGAVAAMLFRYHSNKTIQDVLTRLDTDKLIGTLVFSDPATGMEVWYPGAIQPSRHVVVDVSYLYANIIDFCFHAMIDLADFCN